MTPRSSHASLDTIVVGKNDQALQTGTIKGTGNSVNIADGQFGLLSTSSANVDALNNFVAATTAAEVEKFQFVAGTPNSNNISAVSRFGIGAPAYVRTNDIYLNKVQSVMTKLPKVEAYHGNMLSAFTPVAGEAYGLQIQLESQKRDVDHGKAKRDIYTNAAIEIPSGLTSTADYLIQNGAVQLNKRDSVYVTGLEQFIVFGVNTTGGAGQALGTVAPNTVITFMTENGTNYTYTADLAFTNMLRKAIVATPALATATIEILDTTNAGAAANVDAMLVVGFNENRSVYDEFTHEKIRPTLFITDVSPTGYSTLDKTSTYFYGVENDSSARTWRIRWNKNAAFRMGSKMPVGHTYDVTTAANYNPISTDDSVLYTNTIIKYFGDYVRPVANPRVPSQLTILLEATITNPTADANTALTIATNDTTTVASLNATLGALLSSASDTRNNIAYLEDATKAAPFV